MRLAEKLDWKGLIELIYGDSQLPAKLPIKQSLKQDILRGEILQQHKREL
jgi:hypothetical protein